MKTVNINAQDGFKVAIEEIQFYNQDFQNHEGETIAAYAANVAVQVGDSGVVMICLHGNEEEAGQSWPDNADDWSSEDADFQRYVQEHFTAREFLECLEEECGLENNQGYLEENKTNI